jgi:hypothetical protein
MRAEYRPLDSVKSAAGIGPSRSYDRSGNRVANDRFQSTAAIGGRPPKVVCFSKQPPQSFSAPAGVGCGLYVGSSSRPTGTPDPLLPFTLPRTSLSVRLALIVFRDQEAAARGLQDSAHGSRRMVFSPGRCEFDGRCSHQAPLTENAGGMRPEAAGSSVMRRSDWTISETRAAHVV